MHAAGVALELGMAIDISLRPAVPFFFLTVLLSPRHAAIHGLTGVAA